MLDLTTAMPALANLIVSGFAPDPSVCLVDGVFYLVTSSFHIFPGLPIYCSRDLINWNHIGNAINRTTQLDLSNALTTVMPLDGGRHMVAAGGLWAPTIRHHKGKFYIISTYVSPGDGGWDTRNFYISTDCIQKGKWSDPIYFEWHGIDPSLFFDDDDRCYVQGNWMFDVPAQPSSTIKQVEIDIATGSYISPIKEIWSGFVCYDTEAPHIYKKDGYYYLLVAEGGTFENHLLSIARSRDIWGPYESCPQNPILTAKGTSSSIQNVGHGDLFQDTSGRWWAVVLGVRNDRGRYPLGRESFLTKMSWPEGEWPTIELPEVASPPKSGATGTVKPVTPTSISHVYIRSPQLSDYNISSADACIKVLARPSDLSSRNSSPTFTGKRQRDPVCQATATLMINDSHHCKPLRTGLAIWKDEHRHASICYDYRTQKISAVYVNTTDTNGEGNKSKIDHSPVEADRYDFKVSSDRDHYVFSYRIPGVHKDWQRMTSIDIMGLTARDFTGPIIGVFASTEGDSKLDGAEVCFEEVQLK